MTVSAERRSNVILWLVLTGSFLVYGAIAFPLPSVNEPHYLAKARHFWEPDWLAGDLFLDSADAHVVYFVAFGWMLKFLSFEAVAWIGRALGAALLAAGWLTAFTPWFRDRWSSLLAAWLFLGLQAMGNFSGEWVIGGVESKVFAYGFLLLAIGAWNRSWLVASAACLGLAISWHPVVGAWGTLAVLLMRAREVMREVAVPRADLSLGARCRSAIGSLLSPTQLAAAGAFAVCALPGLIPALALVLNRSEPSAEFAGTYIQVFYRLKHHLDPMTFATWAWWMAGLQLGLWGLAYWWLRPARGSVEARWHELVWWLTVFAAVGVLVSFGPRPPANMPDYEWRMKLLKFYPFRVADVAVPIACALLVARGLEQWLTSRIRWTTVTIVLALTLVSVNANAQHVRYRWTSSPDWIDACRWISRNLPPDALVQTPPDNYTFKWYAQRREFVSFKDCPQDNAGIMEWNRRLQVLERFYRNHFSDGYSADEMGELHRTTGITHLVTDKLGPIDLPVLYQNRLFRVYDLRAGEQGSPDNKAAD
jgi:hypothetical protein